MATNASEISWQAEEYIVRNRNAFWYVGLFVIGGGLSALAVWQGWWTFLIAIVLSIITILITALRPPRKIQYSLNDDGLTEEGRLHKFVDYKAFGILKEETNFSIVLIPKKRLNLSTKVYFTEDNGEIIVDILGAHLPMQEIKLDFLDKIVNFLRI